MTTTTWLRQRHRRVMRGLRIFFGIQIMFSVGAALALDLIDGRPLAWVSLGSGALVGLLLLPAARRALRWLYIPVVLGTDIVHVTALLWAAPPATLARGSLWALAYIPVLVAAGRWWSYPGGVCVLAVVLAADGAALFARLPWRAALPVFVFQSATAALGTWAAAHSESRTRRDLLHTEALHLSEEKVAATIRGYQAIAGQLAEAESLLASLDIAPAAAAAVGEARARLAAAKLTAHRTLRDVGGLPLAGRTLPEAIAAELRALRQEASFDTVFSCDGHLPPTRPVVNEFLWKLVQESLSAARRPDQAPDPLAGSPAAARLEIDLYGEHDSVVLRIRHDGAGAGQAASDGSAGFEGLQAQAAALGGALAAAGAPGGGAQIEARVPAHRPR